MDLSRRQLVIATGGVAFLGGCLGNDSSDNSSSDDSPNQEGIDITVLEEADDPSDDAVDFIVENNHEFTRILDLRLLDLEVYYDDDVTIADLADKDGRVDERIRSSVKFEEKETKYFTNVLDSEVGYNVIIKNKPTFTVDDVDSKYEEEFEKFKQLADEADESLDDSDLGGGNLWNTFEEDKIDDSVPNPWEETELLEANFDWEREDPDSTLYIEITPEGEVVYEEIS